MSRLRTLSVIYCDDVRLELNNKHSLIGCYQDVLWVEQLPVVLARFAIYARVSTPADHPFHQLSLRAFYSGEQIAELIIPCDRPAQAIASSPSAELSATGVMMISPLALAGPGTLRVEASTEEGILVGQSLEIREGLAAAQI